MGAHLAPTLKVLRNEVNKRWPHRDRASDGWIGDAAHQARKSDHNPDGDDGSVNALDIDKDGIDPLLVVRRCIQHPSTEYVIFDRTIWSRSRGFRPARYTGSNPHDKHIHVSVSHTRSREDSTRTWGIPTSSASKLGDRTLHTGSKGSDVRELQNLANKLGALLVVDGVFGSATHAWVRAFQKARKLTVDGIVGSRTIAVLREATKPKPKPRATPAGHRPGTRTVRRGMSGDDVAFVQRFIGERQCGEPSGTYDTHTEAGVRWYQRIQGIDDDGIVGRVTWAKIRVTVTY
ncbi:peptidoglycan-binding protein [Micromonospora sp. 4G55]|uniref:peptidoglycan-binding domain-containing protein n=1 Tax=Micromonospora sp. 4G55 TaxID=2806102 RepID=UPI001A48D808|nr:peptidoglycan-binding protein [Micromonospora sp. 4G55]MBM0259141.1 peptidoglycan-binding protein [Micromonospora sp. 4G55]